MIANKANKGDIRLDPAGVFRAAAKVFKTTQN